jgi:ATP-dependent helicase/nuclease subunit A
VRHAKARKIPDGCWYQLVDEALRDGCVAEPADDGDGEVLRYRKGAPEPEQPVKPIEQPAPDIVLPAWLTRAAAPDLPRWRTITPSSIEEYEAARPARSGGSDSALLRGRLVHRLMQALPEIPPARRRKAAEDYLARPAPIGGESAAIAEQVGCRASALHRAYYRGQVPIVGASWGRRARPARSTAWRSRIWC